MIPSSIQLRPKVLKFLIWVPFLSLALGLRCGLAICFPSLFHSDEIFQTLEPAHRLAYGYGVVSWEWIDGVRSWVFPAFLAGVMRATDWAGAGSSGYLLGTKVVLSLISLSTIWFGYAWARRASGTQAAVIAAGACAIYFGLVFFAPKAFNEIVATHLLLPGLYLGVYAEGTSEKKRLFFAGILCGLAVMLRIQLLPAVAFAAAYFCYPSWRRRIPAVLAGLSLPVLAFGLVDRFTWSYPWESVVHYFQAARYFQAHLDQGHGVGFDSMPWYWYLRGLLLLLGPAVVFLWHGARKSPFLAYFSLVVVGSHSFIALKAVRFIYPVLPLALTLASIGVVEVVSSWNLRSKRAFSPKFTVAFGLVFFSLSSISLFIACHQWYRVNGEIAAMDRLSHDSALCGLGLYQFPWGQTGGYVHLHRNVPLLPLSSREELARDASSFNALLAPLPNADVPSAFKPSGCWNGVCLLRREGGCVPPPPGDEVNAILRAQAVNLR